MLRSVSRRMAKNFDFVVVGGGNAAGYACKEFAAQGGYGKVAVISSEPVLPYERPALTKAYLHPPTAKVRARLPGFHTSVGGGGERQTEEWYEKHGIEIVKGRANAVDLKAKSIALASGESVSYGKMLLATGCRALQVSKFGVKGDDLGNVFYVREEKEAGELVQALEKLDGKGHAVIVGGGYIGLECAAALVGWGIETTMVFPEKHCMPRLFDAELGKWLEDQYTARGVKLVKGDTVAEFTGEGGAVSSVRLQSGASLPCNLAVVGVGAAPNVEFCEGLDMDKGGFKVDAAMQTSDPNIFAIGDVCAFPSKYGGSTRCEHVDHARKSAAQAVQAALGKEPAPYSYLPYFYSRLFEYTDAPIVFNFFGDDSGECQTCPRGDKSIAATWTKDGKIVGALLMGSPGPSPEDAGKLKELVSSGIAMKDGIFDELGL